MILRLIINGEIRMKIIKNVVILLLFIKNPMWGYVFITPEEAIQKYFSNYTIEKKRIYLSEKEIKNLNEHLGFKVKHRFYSFYIAKENQNIKGYAILHTDVVRTKEMSIMIFLDPEFRIQNIVLISFSEPIEYKPGERWLNLFKNKKLEDIDRLIPGIDIPVVSGATLTSRTVSEMVRLTLKLKNYL